jgi:hypothetical protein
MFMPDAAHVPRQPRTSVELNFVDDMQAGLSRNLRRRWA